MTRRATLFALFLGLSGQLGFARAHEPAGRSEANRAGASDPFRNALYQVWEQPSQGRPLPGMLNLEFNPAPVPPGVPARGNGEAPTTAGFVGPAQGEALPAEAKPQVVATALPPAKPTVKDSGASKTEAQPTASGTAAHSRRSVDAHAVALVDPSTLKQIPRSEAGRKATSRQWLKDARAHLAAGRVDQAEALADQLSELAVEYGRFEDNPRDLARDIATARQKEIAAGLLPSSERAPR